MIVSPRAPVLARQVVQYVTFIDGFDEPAGHGTHVMGTLAGDVGPR